MSEIAERFSPRNVRVARTPEESAAIWKGRKCAFSAVGLQLWWLTIVGLAAIASALLLKGQYRTARPAAELVRETPERPAA